ncbi:MAG: S8 family serine peptidase, partial [Rikenella sp.]|nr:S8 family serine peptidase [Rikenella sp.]
KGGLVIFAAGNDCHILGDQITWPAAYAPTIAGASIAPVYTPAYYTDFGSWVDITAPGGELYSNYSNGGVLSTVLDDALMTFKDGRDKSGCGYMQGTSMACPHVSGVAALGLSYAAKLGKQFTADEFKTMLLSSVNDINPYMTGTKRVGSTTLRLANYNKKMGTGYVDAYKMLLEVEGTPSIYIRNGESTTVDLTTYFGAGAKYASFKVAVDADVKSRLGMSTPTVKDGKLTVMCSKAGAGAITLSTVTTSTGEPEMSKKLAIIAREFVAGNGGWL